MGCDIHWYVERLEDDGWTCINADQRRPPKPWEFDDRNYEVFGILAGVRSSNTPIDYPRGVPEDASQFVQLEAADLDWHSHTWYTVRELLDYDWAEAEEQYDIYLCRFVQVLAHLAALGDPEKTRVVIWFDS